MATVFGLRSWYSYGEGYLSPRDAVAAAKENGATCVAFADKGEMGGYFEFIDACREEGMKYIPGIEVNLKCSGETRQALVFGLKADGEKKLLEMLAKSTLAQQGSLDPDVSDALPVVTPDMLASTLMVLSGQHGSHMMGYRRRHEISSAKDFIRDITKSGARLAFAVDPESIEKKEERFFNEIAGTGIKTIPFRPGVIRNSGQLPDYQAVAQVAFQGAPEHFSYEIPVIQTTKDLAGRSVVPGYDEAAIEKLAEVAAIVPEKSVSGYGDLSYQGLTPEASADLLRKRCNENFAIKIADSEKRPGRKFISPEIRPIYTERLERELAIVIQLKFQSRLLIMADLANYCKASGHEAFVRGSAANSVICWMLGLSKPDPISRNLPLERFLNPERPTMPDIDIDIPKSFSEQAFAFMGKSVPHSVRIKQPRDAALGDFIAKLAAHLDIRGAEKMGDSLRRALEIQKFPKGATIQMLEATYPKFRETFIGLRDETDGKMEELYAMLSIVGNRPLGFNPHVGLAACETPVETKVPVLPMRLPNGTVVLTTGVEHSVLEQHGVLKFDLLPRKTLDWMQRIQKRASEIEHLPTLDDIAATNATRPFKLIQDGLVAGIDQIHKHAETLKTLTISNFQQLSAFIALIRPGASGGDVARDEKDPRPPGVARFLKGASPLKDAVAAMGKRAKDVFSEVTSETNGMIIYQEQFTELLHKLSGEPVGKCEILRGYMAKKKAAPAKTVDNLVASIAKNFGIAEKPARNAVEQLLGEGDYLFAKGHAATYAVVALHQLAIKNLVPAAYVAGYIDHSRMDDNADSGGVFKEKLASMMGDIGKQGVAILPMDFSKNPLTAIEGEMSSAPPLRRRLRLGLDAVSTVPTKEVERVRNNLSILKSEIAKGAVPTPERMQEAPFFLSGDTIAKAAFLGAFSQTKRKATEIARKFAPTKIPYKSPAEAAWDILGFVPNFFHPGIPNSFASDGRMPVPLIAIDDVRLYDGDAKPFHVAGYITEPPRRKTGAAGSTIVFQIGALRGEPVRVKMLFYTPMRDRSDSTKVKRLEREADQCFALLSGHHQKNAFSPICIQVEKEVYMGQVSLRAVTKRIDFPPAPNLLQNKKKLEVLSPEIGEIKESARTSVETATLPSKGIGDK